MDKGFLVPKWKKKYIARHEDRWIFARSFPVAKDSIQYEDVLFHETGMSSPVMTKVLRFIILILIVMARMYGELSDVKQWIKLFHRAKNHACMFLKDLQNWILEMCVHIVENYFWLKSSCFGILESSSEDSLNAVGLTRSKA